MSMERLTYENFIADLNNGSILEISFEILGYAHYKECKICRKDDVLSNGKIISLIKVKLVDDGSEKLAFIMNLTKIINCFIWDVKVHSL